MPLCVATYAYYACPMAAEFPARIHVSRGRVLALVAAILLIVELATYSYLWVNHVQASPATPTLQCADVDPFTCHEAADKAMENQILANL